MYDPSGIPSLSVDEMSNSPVVVSKVIVVKGSSTEQMSYLGPKTTLQAKVVGVQAGSTVKSSEISIIRVSPV